MERVYLLLSNNLQSGPFTIGELLQQQLRPSDMIWIEGKSSAWTYLSELELTPFIIAKDSVPDKNTEIPAKDEIERKAEELRQKVLASAPKHFPSIPMQRETYSSPYKLPDNEIRFVDHRSERKTILGELAITFFIIGLFGVGIYKGREFLSEKKTVSNAVATKLVTNDQHSAQKNTTVANAAPVTDTTFRDSSYIMKAKPKATVKKITDSTTSVKSQTEIVPLDQAQNEIQENPEKDPSENTQPEVKLPEAIPVKKEVKASTKPFEEKEEKKGFLKGLFKKKKKNEE